MQLHCQQLYLKYGEQKSRWLFFNKSDLEKMEYFKRRAREILMSDNEIEYEGAPMPIGGAYK